jgi:branched-chain amino acid aminotransferase
MEPVSCFDGEFIPSEDCLLKPSNRAFRYGDGLFETIRVHEGRVLWADRHWNRLRRGASVLQMILPASLHAAAIQDLVGEICRRNHPEGGAVRVRLSLFRRDGGFYTPATNRASFLIESEKLAGPSYSLNEKGLRIGIFPDFGKAPGPLSNLKSSSALVLVMASLYKTAEQLDDCLVLNHLGHIAEASSSNVFAVKNNLLLTPGLDQACVDGVMRGIVRELAHDQGLAVKEVPLTLAELEQADGLFLTNTIQGIAWVGRFRHRQYSRHVPAALMDRLRALAH